jgi:peptidoglycan L-alanyl-D-glutamate endopeptidase CwlK
MAKFSKASLAKLNTCHQDLIELFREVIQIYDCTIICGTRYAIDQDKAFAEGRSKLKWPKSKHNTIPSMAVDVAPYPLDWENINEFYFLAGIVFTLAAKNGVKIKWGGKFKTLQDYGHFELEE